MNTPDNEVSWKKLPWIEIGLVLALVVMIVAGVNALFGAGIREGITGVCDDLDLWCAPTPTMTPTPTPTQTPTPALTLTPSPTSTSTP